MVGLFLKRVGKTYFSCNFLKNFLIGFCPIVLVLATSGIFNMYVDKISSCSCIVLYVVV